MTQSFIILSISLSILSLSDTSFRYGTQKSALEIPVSILDSAIEDIDGPATNIIRLVYVIIFAHHTCTGVYIFIIKMI